MENERHHHQRCDACRSQLEQYNGHGSKQDQVVRATMDTNMIKLAMHPWIEHPRQAQSHQNGRTLLLLDDMNSTNKQYWTQVYSA